MSNGKIKDWATYAEIVSSIAVVASLVFVVRSIDQNTKAIEAAEMNNINAGWREAIQIPILTDPELADLIARARAGESLTPGELIKWDTMIGAKLDVWGQVFSLHQSGVISDEAWQEWEGGFWVHWKTDNMASRWADKRPIYDKDFQQYIEAESQRIESSN